MVSLVGTWATLGSAPFWAYDPVTMRVSSTLLKSNQLPSYVAPMLVLLLFVSSLRSSRLWLRLAGMVGIFFIIISMFGTGSRTALLLLVLSFVITFVWGVQNRNQPSYNEKLLYLFGGLIVISVAAYIFQIWNSGLQYHLSSGDPTTRAILRFRNAEAGAGPVLGSRGMQIQVVIRHFMDHPILGIGPGNFPAVFHMNEVHNTYFGVLINQGIPSLIFLLGWLATVLYIGWSYRHAFNQQQSKIVLCLWFGFVLLLIYGLTMFGLDQRHFWIMAGLLCALPRIATNERSGNERYNKGAPI